jgi:TIP41-like family
VIMATSLSYQDTLMAGAVAVPKHTLSESPNSRSIDIFDWTVTAETGPISNATQCDALHRDLGIPLPEMTFGSNLLRIAHRPSGWTYAFRAEHALKEVKNGPLGDGDGGVKVGYADAWLKSRCAFRLPSAPPRLSIPRSAHVQSVLIYACTFSARP